MINYYFVHPSGRTAFEEKKVAANKENTRYYLGTNFSRSYEGTPDAHCEYDSMIILAGDDAQIITHGTKIAMSGSQTQPSGDNTLHFETESDSYNLVDTGITDALEVGTKISVHTNYEDLTEPTTFTTPWNDSNKVVLVPDDHTPDYLYSAGVEVNNLALIRYYDYEMMYMGEVDGTDVWMVMNTAGVEPHGMQLLQEEYLTVEQKIAVYRYLASVNASGERMANSLGIDYVIYSDSDDNDGHHFRIVVKYIDEDIDIDCYEGLMQTNDNDTTTYIVNNHTSLSVKALIERLGKIETENKNIIIGITEIVGFIQSTPQCPSKIFGYSTPEIPFGSSEQASMGFRIADASYDEGNWSGGHKYSRLDVVFREDPRQFLETPCLFLLNVENPITLVADTNLNYAHVSYEGLSSDDDDYYDIEQELGNKYGMTLDIDLMGDGALDGDRTLPAGTHLAMLSDSSLHIYTPAYGMVKEPHKAITNYDIYPAVSLTEPISAVVENGYKYYYNTTYSHANEHGSSQTIHAIAEKLKNGELTDDDTFIYCNGNRCAITIDKNAATVIQNIDDNPNYFYVEFEFSFIYGKSVIFFKCVGLVNSYHDSLKIYRKEIQIESQYTAITTYDIYPAVTETGNPDAISDDEGYVKIAERQFSNAESSEITQAITAIANKLYNGELTNDDTFVYCNGNRCAITIDKDAVEKGDSGIVISFSFSFLYGNSLVFFKVHVTSIKDTISIYRKTVDIETLLSDTKKAVRSKSNIIDCVYFESDTLLSLVNKASGEAVAKADINLDGETISCYATLKVQGNSSAGYPKKNYTVKFFSDEACKTKLKIDAGWGKQNKYCFKANYIDATHLRNIASANLVAEMVESRPDSDFKAHLMECPNHGQVDGYPIKVFVNGAFHGIYTWNIPKDAWTFNMNDKDANNIVICSDLHTDCTNFKAHWTSENASDWKVEAGPLSVEQIQPKFNDLIDFITDSSDEDFADGINDHIDLYSVIDYYCYCALAYHPDGISKNALLVSYDGGDKWGLVLYDMDATFCLHWNGQSFYDIDSRGPEIGSTSNLLFERIRKCFGDELRSRYFALREKTFSFANIYKAADTIADKITPELHAKEFAKWTGIPQQSTNTADTFKEKVYQRTPIVDSRMALVSDGMGDILEARTSIHDYGTDGYTTDYPGASSYDFPGANGDPYVMFFDVVVNSQTRQFEDFLNMRNGEVDDVSSDMWFFAYDGKIYINNAITLPYTIGTHLRGLVVCDTAGNRVIYIGDKAYPLPVLHAKTQTNKKLFYAANMSTDAAYKGNITIHELYVEKLNADIPLYLGRDLASKILLRQFASKVAQNIHVFSRNISNSSGSTLTPYISFGVSPFDATASGLYSGNIPVTVSNVVVDNSLMQEVTDPSTGLTTQQTLVPTVGDGYVTFENVVANSYGTIDFDLVFGSMIRHIEYGFMQDLSDTYISNRPTAGSMLYWGNSTVPYIPSSLNVGEMDFTILLQCVWTSGDGVTTGGSATFAGRNGVLYPDLITFRYAETGEAQYGATNPCFFTTATALGCNTGDAERTQGYDGFNGTLTEGQSLTLVIRKRGNHIMACSNFGFYEYDLPDGTDFAPGRCVYFFTYRDYIVQGLQCDGLYFYKGACTKEWALSKCGLDYKEYMHW